MTFKEFIIGFLVGIVVTFIVIAATIGIASMLSEFITPKAEAAELGVCFMMEYRRGEELPIGIYRSDCNGNKLPVMQGTGR